MSVGDEGTAEERRPNNLLSAQREEARAENQLLKAELTDLVLAFDCLSCGRILASEVYLLAWDSPHGDETCQRCGGCVTIARRDVLVELAELQRLYDTAFRAAIAQRDLKAAELAREQRANIRLSAELDRLSNNAVAGDEVDRLRAALVEAEYRFSAAIAQRDMEAKARSGAELDAEHMRLVLARAAAANNRYAGAEHENRRLRGRVEQLERVREAARAWANEWPRGNIAGAPASVLLSAVAETEVCICRHSSGQHTGFEPVCVVNGCECVEFETWPPSNANATTVGTAARTSNRTGPSVEPSADSTDHQLIAADYPPLTDLIGLDPGFTGGLSVQEELEGS